MLNSLGGMLVTELKNNSLLINTYYYRFDGANLVSINGNSLRVRFIVRLSWCSQ
jgi:hypothetical protein